jgi:hypothetical protein
MLDPIINFITQIFAWIGKTIGLFVAWLCWPFIAFWAWFRRSTGILKIILGIIIFIIVVPYLFFVWNSLWIRNYDINYPEQLTFNGRSISAGEQVAIEGGSDTTRTCAPSAIVEVAQNLIDFNVNQNEWMSAKLLYKAGFFGIPWDATPWLDNKASFQRGVHRSISRASSEIADYLGLIRGTSQFDKDLKDAEGNLRIDQHNWYIGLNPVGFKQTSWGSYRSARKKLMNYNLRLSQCGAVFDARADNLSKFLDRIAKDIGSASATIKDRAEQYNGGWFDTRADNVFLDAKGQLYAYYGFVKAARVDFQDIIEKRALGTLWDNMEAQMVSALKIDPLIVSNGNESGAIMPTHLTTLGFYILRVRSNLVEIREVLQK